MVCTMNEAHESVCENVDDVDVATDDDGSSSNVTIFVKAMKSCESNLVSFECY